MRNLSILFLAAFTSIIVSSCQPPKPGGESSAPAKSFGGEVEQPTIQKADSSIEKVVEGRNLKDSVLNGKK